MPDIHPSAIVDPRASLGATTRIGPFCVVGPDVELADAVELKSHVVVEGRTRIGEGTVIYPFTSLGSAPQDLKYHGEQSELIIGKRNRIRENVTMNPGTEGGGMLTSVGDDCLFMVGAHVAHDCHVGSHVILANNATLGGHVTVGDFAIIGGLAAVHQFARIGAHAMIGGMSGVENDVIPYGSVMGERGKLAGLNIIGLKRRGYSKEEMHALRSAYLALFADAGTLKERVAAVEAEYGGHAVVASVLEFVKMESSRGLVLPR